MNTATWASMEADSGGAVPAVGTVAMWEIIISAAYYHMRGLGYTVDTHRYWSLLKIDYAR